MCTLTWWRGDAGEFEVFFNRDEKKTRPLAEEPRVHELNGVRFLSPRDPAGGGTWMLANEFGVVLCLLNRWHEETGEAVSWRSRGQLVWSLADVPNAEAVAERLAGASLAETRPLSLFVCDPVELRGWDWTAGQLREAHPEMPVTSSSWRFEEVAGARREKFAMLGASDPAALSGYHAGDAVATAHTVRMCRPDAQTMSRSEVRVGPGEIRWRYLSEQPDLAGPPDEFCTSLPRHSS